MYQGRIFPVTLAYQWVVVRRFRKVMTELTTNEKSYDKTLNYENLKVLTTETILNF